MLGKEFNILTLEQILVFSACSITHADGVTLSNCKSYDLRQGNVTWECVS